MKTVHNVRPSKRIHFEFVNDPRLEGGRKNAKGRDNDTHKNERTNPSRILKSLIYNSKHVLSAQKNTKTKMFQSINNNNNKGEKIKLLMLQTKKNRSTPATTILESTKWETN